MKQWPPNITFKPKKCITCGLTFKPRSGVQKYCSVCKRKVYNEMHRKYEKTIKGKENKRKYLSSEKGYKMRKNAQLKCVYGITLGDFDRMVEQQNGVCFICDGANADGRRLHIDHNHKTGKIRSLLCSKCNHGIGLFNENIDILEKVINYLKSHKT